MAEIFQNDRPNAPGERELPSSAVSALIEARNARLAALAFPKKIKKLAEACANEPDPSGCNTYRQSQPFGGDHVPDPQDRQLGAGDE